MKGTCILNKWNIEEELTIACLSPSGDPSSLVLERNISIRWNEILVEWQTDRNNATYMRKYGYADWMLVISRYWIWKKNCMRLTWSHEVIIHEITPTSFLISLHLLQMQLESCYDRSNFGTLRVRVGRETFGILISAKEKISYLDIQNRCMEWATERIDS